jgi:hypothetical protein
VGDLRRGRLAPAKTPGPVAELVIKPGRIEDAAAVCLSRKWEQSGNRKRVKPRHLAAAAVSAVNGSCVFGAYRPRNSSVTERRENLIIPRTAAAVAATAANANNAR